MRDEDDQNAIGAVLRGDVNAYSALVARYQKPIYNLAFRMSGSAMDAADLTQESFIKAFEHLPGFSIGKRFFPWLYAISFNHCKNFLRLRRARQDIVNSDCELVCEPDDPTQYEEGIVAKLDSESVWKSLSQLPPDYREALILRYHEELAIDDVAAALGISLSCAKMRIYRGLRKIRDTLEDSVDGKARSKS